MRTINYSLNYLGQNYDISLGLDHKEIIQSCDVIGADFSGESEKIIGNTLGDAQFYSANKASYAVFERLVFSAVRSYYGVTPTYHEQKNKDEFDLLCRCFKIYKSDIEEEMVQNPAHNFYTLNSEIAVGGGCGLCKNATEKCVAIIKSAKAKSLI